MDISKLVDRYRKEIEYKEQADLDSYKKCEDFEHLLQRSVVGVTNDEKRDSHKYRIPRWVLRKMYQSLLRYKEALSECRTFDEVIEIVYNASVKGFNSLSVYDTALAIASYLNLYPDKIFLHRGAEDGAINLLGYDVVQVNVDYFKADTNYPYLLSGHFPIEVRILKPHHIENFLCHYKSEFTKK